MGVDKVPGGSSKQPIEPVDSKGKIPKELEGVEGFDLPIESNIQAKVDIQANITKLKGFGKLPKVLNDNINVVMKQEGRIAPYIKGSHTWEKPDELSDPIRTLLERAGEE